MSGLLYCLASNPNKQDKLYEEIMQIAPDKRAPITYEVLQKASYLKACIKEGFRWVLSACSHKLVSDVACWVK